MSASKIILLVQIEPGPQLIGLSANDQTIGVAKAVSVCLTGLQTSFAKRWLIKIPPECFIPKDGEIRAGEVWFEMTDGKEYLYAQIGTERKRVPKWACAAFIGAVGETYPRPK